MPGCFGARKSVPRRDALDTKPPEDVGAPGLGEQIQPEGRRESRSPGLHGTIPENPQIPPLEKHQVHAPPFIERIAHAGDQLGDRLPVLEIKNFALALKKGF